MHIYVFEITEVCMCVCVCLTLYEAAMKMFTKSSSNFACHADLFSSKAELINDTTNSTTDLNNNINYIISSSNNNDNNNNNNIKNNNNKRSVEEENDKLLPPAHFEEYNLLECICYRPTKVLECRQCHEYFNGRISLLCLEHPTVSRSFQIICYTYLSMYIYMNLSIYIHYL